MTLKLEVGKSYRRADGVKCTVDFDDGSDFARFRATGKTEPRELWYHPDGRSPVDRQWDLIAEWEEPTLPHGHARLPCGKVVDLTNPYGTAFGLLDEVYGAGTQEAMKKHGMKHVIIGALSGVVCLLGLWWFVTFDLKFWLWGPEDRFALLFFAIAFAYAGASIGLIYKQLKD